MAKQVLARCHRTRIELRKGRLESKIQRIANFLVPKQWVISQHLGVCDSILERQPTVCVHTELRISIQLLQDTLDARLVFSNAVTNLHLHNRVAAIHVALHFIAKGVNSLAWIVVTASGIDEDLRIGLTPVSFSQ